MIEMSPEFIVILNSPPSSYMCCVPRKPSRKSDPSFESQSLQLARADTLHSHVQSVCLHIVVLSLWRSAMWVQ